MAKYTCLTKSSYSKNEYTLVSLRKQDIYQIKQWRNSQLAVLRQKKVLTDQDQKYYYENFILPTYTQQFPPQILFSLLRNETLIGYGGLVHISWEDSRAEISFLVDTDRAKNQKVYQNDFENYLHIIKHISFNELHLNRLYLETYDIRENHIQIIEKSGFMPEGRLKEHIIIDGIKIDSLIHGMIREAYYER